MSTKIYLPEDIMVEILKKLPSKSLVKFRCVSKQWSSIINYNKYFIDSIVTRSLTQPQRSHAIFLKTSSSQLYFFTFSSTDPTINNTEPVSIPGSMINAYNYVRGLICCWSIDNSSLVSIYNPTTRQFLYLPELNSFVNHWSTCLFGYDPIEDQYKVLYKLESGVEQTWYVFTLKGQNKWRKIEGTTRLHTPNLPTVCINGVIYYRALLKQGASKYVLMSFDVKSEKFDEVQTPETERIQWWTLIEYKGKLGLMCSKMGIEIWVIEDGETEKWSKIFFCEMKGFGSWPILHVTRGGEIVFINNGDNNITEILYYDPEQNGMRYFVVDNTTLPEFWLFTKIFPDYVENTMSLN